MNTSSSVAGNKFRDQSLKEQKDKKILQKIKKEENLVDL